MSSGNLKGTVGIGIVLFSADRVPIPIPIPTETTEMPVTFGFYREAVA